MRLTRFLQMISLFAGIFLYLAAGACRWEWADGPDGGKRLVVSLQLRFPKPLLGGDDTPQNALTHAVGVPIRMPWLSPLRAAHARGPDLALPPEPRDPHLAGLPPR